MTDFRALCADLAQQLDDALDFTVSSETRRHMKSLVARARAELAESEPPAKRDVTDEDLDAMWNTEAEYFALYSEARRFARAVLARFGGSTVPVPVAERLPGPEDCLDEGWAWFFSPRVGWRQAVLPVSPAYTHWLPAHALPLPTTEPS